MKVEVASWASVPNKPTVSVDVKQHFNNKRGIGFPGFSTLVGHWVVPVVRQLSLHTFEI